MLFAAAGLSISVNVVSKRRRLNAGGPGPALRQMLKLPSPLTLCRGYIAWRAFDKASPSALEMPDQEAKWRNCAQHQATESTAVTRWHEKVDPRSRMALS